MRMEPRTLCSLGMCSTTELYCLDKVRKPLQGGISAEAGSRCYTDIWKKSFYAEGTALPVQSPEVGPCLVILWYRQEAGETVPSKQRVEGKMRAGKEMRARKRPLGGIPLFFRAGWKPQRVLSRGGYTLILVCTGTCCGEDRLQRLDRVRVGARKPGGGARTGPGRW